METKETMFREFMARKYAEAEEYAVGVTRAQEDIALDAWETAWDAALKDASKKRLAAQGILSRYGRQTGDREMTFNDIAHVIRAIAQGPLPVEESVAAIEEKLRGMTAEVLRKAASGIFECSKSLVDTADKLETGK